MKSVPVVKSRNLERSLKFYTRILDFDRKWPGYEEERSVTFRTRALETTQRPESRVHTAPVDQTWGLREFAVTDPAGNEFCFCMVVG
jgi:catechol 2,3-dioxygenase-like lactoylglutathione lyase family enzyme